jgi:type II secretory pathway component PulF
MVAVALTVIVPPFTSQFQQLILQLPSAAKALKELLLQAFSSVNSMVYGSGVPAIGANCSFPKAWQTAQAGLPLPPA